MLAGVVLELVDDLAEEGDGDERVIAVLFDELRRPRHHHSRQFLIFVPPVLDSSPVGEPISVCSIVNDHVT